MKAFMIAFIAGLMVASALAESASEVDHIEQCKADILLTFGRMDFTQSLEDYYQRLRAVAGDESVVSIPDSQEKVLKAREVERSPDCGIVADQALAAFTQAGCRALSESEQDQMVKTIEPESTLDRFLGTGTACIISESDDEISTTAEV